MTEQTTQTAQTTAPVATVKEVAPAAKPVVKPAPAQQLSSEAGHILSVLKEYASAVDPKKVLSVDDLAAHQYRLWMNLSTTVENVTIDKFREVWNTVLGFVNKNKDIDGVFNERFAMRGVNHWRGGPVAESRYSRLLDLMRQTSNPATRKNVIAHTKVSDVLNGFSDQAISKVADFYSGE